MNRPIALLLRLMLLLIMVFVPFGFGCATAVYGTHGEMMAEIDSLEGEIEAQLMVSGGGGECVDRCRAMESICDCADRICLVARDLAELDALESCRRAEEHCHEARRRVETECTCEASVEAPRIEHVIGFIRKIQDSKGAAISERPRDHDSGWQRKRQFF